MRSRMKKGYTNDGQGHKRGMRPSFGLLQEKAGKISSPEFISHVYFELRPSTWYLRRKVTYSLTGKCLSNLILWKVNLDLARPAWITLWSLGSSMHANGSRTPYSNVYSNNSDFGMKYLLRFRLLLINYHNLNCIFYSIILWNKSYFEMTSGFWDHEGDTYIKSLKWFFSKD
jgi:hypothetical protein